MVVARCFCCSQVFGVLYSNTRAAGTGICIVYLTFSFKCFLIVTVRISPENDGSCTCWYGYFGPVMVLRVFQRGPDAGSPPVCDVHGSGMNSSFLPVSPQHTALSPLYTGQEGTQNRDYPAFGSKRRLRGGRIGWQGSEYRCCSSFFHGYQNRSCRHFHMCR